MKSGLICILLALCAVISGGAEENNLKFYASFDRSAEPELALDGAGLREAGKLSFVEGKYGKALHFSRKDSPGDLQYNLGGIFSRNEWTVAMWVRPDQPGNANYGSREPGRNLFRTNLGWECGNIFAGFDNWGKFILNHFDAKNRYRGVAFSSLGFAPGEWVHLAFGCRNGKHRVFINGNEAACTKNEDVTEPGPLQTVLRLGSMDFRAGDQFEGAIDELKLFDKCLTAEEVREAMESTPGKVRRKTLVYDPFEGETAPAGAGSFTASELVFPSGGGVKIIRHGYDRRGSLVLERIPGLGGPAVSLSCRFTPEWNGADDRGTHGILYADAPGLRCELAKRGEKLAFTLASGGNRHEITLDAAPLKKGIPATIAAGFDLVSGELYLALDGTVERKRTAPVPPSAAGAATGKLGVGDLPDTDVYARTQAEGTIAELFAVDAFVLPDELARLHAAERAAWERKRAGETLAQLPVRPAELPLWSLNGAETVSTATRRRMTLNALWRFQLTAPDRPFDVRNWEYLAVPGRYSGQGNGLADCEFYRRNAQLARLPRNADYHGRSPYDYVSGYFERAFRADPAWRGRQVIFLLDELSRSQKGTLYLNGRKLADLPEGAFFEIPLPAERLKFGEDNFLTIHAVDDGGYWNWRGIKGDTALLIKPPVTAEYPGIVTSVTRKTITFELTLRNRSAAPATLRAEARIAGGDAPDAFVSPDVTLAPGEEKTISFGGRWENPRLWSPDTPHLYTAHFQLKSSSGTLIDEPEPVRFGFREFELRGRDYYLNGSRIHLFNHDGWANASSDPEEARRVARTLKRLGYNSVRTLFPVEAKDNYPDNIMRICDEEGLLQFVNLDGVTGREFAIWNDPEVRRNLETRMAASIRRRRNHPSCVMYFLSSNFLGYGWDYHPLKMADGYLPAFQKSRAGICSEAVKIMRKYDPSRPFFFQAGGNFGPVITSNAYFCWWPQAERNAWPEVWSTIGTKPLHIIETGFPYIRSFYGMDLQYPGEKPLFYYENLARYYGPAVYRDSDREMLASTAASTQGKAAEVYYDAPWHQKLRSDLLRETIPLWRSFGISGICPFSEIHYAFRKHAPHRTSHTAKAWEVEAPEFRRFGWTPDLRKIQYQSDIDPSRPLPVASALADALAPRLTLLDGGAAAPSDRRRNYFGGETLRKGLTLINDTQAETRFETGWRLLDAAGKTVAGNRTGELLAPGETARLPVEVKLPAVSSRSSFRLTAAGAARALEITVFPRPAARRADSVALYDEKGLTAAALQAAGITCRNAAGLDTLDGITLLAVGRESLTPEFASFALRMHLKERIDAGKLNVLFFEQTPEALAGLGLRARPVYAREVFLSPALSLPGLSDGDCRDWAGNGTLAPSEQPPAPETEESVASPLWHWSNRNMVASYPLRRPVEGDCRILATCGMDLLYTPLLEMRSGAGRIVFCQLEISGRSEPDPAALLVASGLVTAYAAPNPEREETEFLAPAAVTPAETAGYLEKVRNGAVLLAPPGSGPLFGLREKTENVNRFAFTPAGKAHWPDLTERDGFLRAPQTLTVLSGKGLIPLTLPAFAAELRYGRGRIIFLETPADPQREERERGRKNGPDSSAEWSAEILAERFAQLRNRIIAANGPGLPSTAERLERPLAAGQQLDLSGRWEFKAGDGGKPETVVVPGFYNLQLPHHEGFVGIAEYRRTVTLPEHFRGRELLLDLGAVDDLDESFVNGVKIGATGEETAGYWAARRRYPVPADLTQSGRLDIVIRAENLRGNGGITGHARLLLPEKDEDASEYPYTGLNARYDTETHVRW